MKNYKKIVSFFLAVLTLTAVTSSVSCGSDTDTTTESTPTTSAATEAVTEDPGPKLELPAADYGGKYGEFDLMKRYVLAKLMWNPDCDMDVHVNEYLHGVYGAAAGEVRRYFDLLQGLITPDTHLWIYENPDADYLTDEFLEAGDTCLARAEIAADDDETLQRVRVLRLSTRYAILCRMAMDDPRRASGWDAFYRDVTAAGIDTFYWRQMPDSAMEFLRAGDLKFRWK